MSRTNIDIDDDAVAEVMARYRIRTKREAVDFALNEVRRRPMSAEEILALRGIGWDGPELDEMRPPIEDFEVSPQRRAELEKLLKR